MSHGSILNEISKESLKKYLSICKQYVPIDEARAYAACVETLRGMQGRPVNAEAVAPIKLLEKRWYDSLLTGKPDYSVYADPYYFCDIWNCWVLYSRRYLREIQSPKSFFNRSIVSAMGNVHTVLDLGCGFGYTTAGFREIFPQAEVVGTNLEGTAQYAMASVLGAQRNFDIAPTYDDVRPTLAFASEYFEHFEEPIDHLADVLEKTRPRFMLIANTFTGQAIGHFNTYKYKGQSYTGLRMSKMFGQVMRHFGYEKIKTKCWNSKPAFWVRQK